MELGLGFGRTFNEIYVVHVVKVGFGTLYQLWVFEYVSDHFVIEHLTLITDAWRKVEIFWNFLSVVEFRAVF